MAPQELESLITFSARIGRDLNLVQAGGGNTSLKDNGVLWIKASGKWLVNADQEEMFVPVPLADIMRDIADGRERYEEYTTSSGLLLRASVETTMHAVLPHRVVVHVHSVQAIAWAVRADGKEALDSRLRGVRWAWIPYIHPGLPLARRIQQAQSEKPDVLILENHGLVVAADRCDTAAALLEEVERRLTILPQPAPDFDAPALTRLADGTQWRVHRDEEIHALATNRLSAMIASTGTMYPDHCVYLGPAAALVRVGESVESTVNQYMARYSYQPAFVLVEGKGVLSSSELSRAGRELLFCLKRVVERIPADTEIRYLEDFQVAKLMNWDAEKYRISIARLQQ